MKIVKVAENIISPLGFSVKENFDALCSGFSSLKRYENFPNLPFPFVASLIDDTILNQEFEKFIDYSRLKYKNPTKLEKISLLSVVKAIENSNIDPKSPQTLFVFSSTKGNVNLLKDKNCDKPRVFLGDTAEFVASYFDNPNNPIVVSNACISGLCAQIEAIRCIKSSRFDTCVVVGADEISPFIISGFNCLKALSDEPCKPFSINRKGLNLGEAAATVVYSAKQDDFDGWKIICGAIRNDANHISGPSRTADGSFQALKYVLDDSQIDNHKIACINVHGTATQYNDEMESIAISRAQLSDIPINALKGYYGHTLGAAGILESLITMKSLDEGIILPTRGFDASGVSQNINIVDDIQYTDKQIFIKLLSGFGGCNAAALFTK